MSDAPPPTAAAENFATFIEQNFDLELDFSPDSLRPLDSIIEAVSAEARRQLAANLTAYLGAVLLRSYGGEWTCIDDDVWVVEMGHAHPEDDEYRVPLYQLTETVLERKADLPTVHDELLGLLDLDAPLLEPDDTSELPGVSMDRWLRKQRRMYAEKLVEDWPDYDLDFTPESLAELDRLIADEFDTSPDDVDRDDRQRERSRGTVPEDADFDVRADEQTITVASYLGGVFYRNYAAHWRDDDPFAFIVVEDDDGWSMFQPTVLATAAFAGYVSLKHLHDDEMGDLSTERE